MGQFEDAKSYVAFGEEMAVLPPGFGHLEWAVGRIKRLNDEVRFLKENRPPTVTQEYREAMSGEGELAGQWHDKPHRLVYDLCAEVDALRDVMRKGAKVAAACGHPDTCECWWCELRHLLEENGKVEGFHAAEYDIAIEAACSAGKDGGT